MATLDVVEFGRALIETRDLDPVYCALVGCDWDTVTLNRWLLAYWCFYDAGVASYIAAALDADHYWDLMHQAAANETPTPLGTRWRRAAERRHFRGRKAVEAVARLKATYGLFPENMVHVCAARRNRSKFLPGGGQISTPVDHVFRAAKNHFMLGDWISFKIADMLERVCGEPIDFDAGLVFMFKDPVEGAKMVWAAESGEGQKASAEMADYAGTEPSAVSAGEKATSHMIDWSVNFLQQRLGDLEAPPGGRLVGLQEIETVLCKWKSHMKGNYPVGKDTHEIRDHIHPWARYTKLAQDFYDNMP